MWDVSLVLAGAALTIMFTLILLRLLRQRRTRDLAQQRRRLIPILLGDASDEDIIAASKRHSPVLGELAIELIQLVRGEERDRFVATASRLGIPDQLHRKLRSGSARERILAAEVLGEFPDHFSSAALEAALDDRNADVRLAAAIALATSDRAPSVEQLVEMLSLGTSEQSMLIVALFREVARVNPQELRDLIEVQNTPPAAKAAAIEALVASGDYSLVSVVNTLALEADPQGEELPRYLRALGDFHHPAGRPAIQKWLDAPTWWVRSAAAEAAGKIHITELLADIRALLEDPDWWVRFRAGEALVRLGKPGIAALRDAADYGSDVAQEVALMTLAEQAVRR